jgi:hypothetical protein
MRKEELSTGGMIINLLSKHGYPPENIEVRAFVGQICSIFDPKEMLSQAKKPSGSWAMTNEDYGEVLQKFRNWYNSLIPEE